MKSPVILCIDDESVVLDALMEQLQQKLGNTYEIEIAESGEEALELLNELNKEEVEVPVAIVDYLMPGMQGDEVMKQIHLKSPDTLTILLSGHAGNEEMARAINRGNLYRYVAKPWNKEQLFITINEAIKIFSQEKLIQEHQKAIKELNASLEQQVIERTKELEIQNKQLQHEIAERQFIEKELRKAKEAAEAANHAKSTFLATMSHELRTPLNGILGYAQILKFDSTLTQTQQEGIDIIEKSGQHLLTLLNDLLDLAKIEAGKIELHKNDFYLTSLVENVIEIVRIRAEHKNISFHYQPFNFAKQVPETLPMMVTGDEKHLRQILINLLGNAIKFTDKGGITFKVGPINHLFRFQVEDTGVGMTNEELNLIFEPFQQVGEKSRQTQGTGLGLSISRRLIETMGGQLNVTSQLGSGSVFWFDLSLPIVKEEISDETLSTEKHQVIGISGNKPTLLIVDDQPSNRGVLVHLLAPLGFHIIEADDGKKALAKAIESKPDAIITDLFMPKMDGFELIQQIRQSADLKDKVIIATSASVFETDYHKSLALGSNDFLAKPIKAEQLFEQLQRHLVIKWLYKETQSENTQSEIILPSQTTLMMLFKLAKKGDIEALREQAEIFMQADEKFKPFAIKLCELTQSFNIKNIRCWLKSYLES